MDTLFIWFWSCRDNRLRRHDGFERVNDWNLFHVSYRCPFWLRLRDQLLGLATAQIFCIKALVLGLHIFCPPLW